MPRKANNNNLPSRLQRLSRSNMAVLIAFVLTFAGFGSWFVYHSEASTWYCAQHIYYPYEPGTYHGYCVYQIQNFIDAFHGSYLGSVSGVPYIRPDGVYGSGTANAVAKFQSFVNNHAFIYGTLKSQGALPVTSDGTVGRHTWFAICDTLSNGAVNGYWGPLGCGINTRLYGTAYVK